MTSATLHIKPDNDAIWARYSAGPRNLIGDAGFDIYVPETVTFAPKETRKVSMGVSCAMTLTTETIDKYEFKANTRPTSYYIYPRSSIANTPLRLANSVGIVDSGYRGSIMAALDNISDKPFTLEAGTRVIQLCAPGLISINNIVKVDSFEETVRGARGFGST